MFYFSMKSQHWFLENKVIWEGLLHFSHVFLFYILTESFRNSQIKRHSDTTGIQNVLFIMHHLLFWIKWTKNKFIFITLKQILTSSYIKTHTNKQLESIRIAFEICNSHMFKYWEAYVTKWFNLEVLVKSCKTMWNFLSLSLHLAPVFRCRW